MFIQSPGELLPQGAIVFFEEVQALTDSGLFLKGLVDRKSGFRLLATGSSSFELESQTRESLAGRAHRKQLLPFSLAELAAAEQVPAALENRNREKSLYHLLQYGGYPSVYLTEKKSAVLTGLVESFILRDASDRFRIKHTGAFRRLLELLANQIGNLCNFSEWAANLGISADTVREYTTILSDAHIIRFVRPFAGGKRAEITAAPKVYFIDNGIRNRLFGGFAPVERRADQGALLENFVFTELLKHSHPLLDNIRFWRSKSGAEVDFVLEHQSLCVGIEVKSGNTRGKLTRSSHSFIDAYAPQQFWIISDREHNGFQKNNTEVIFTTPTKFQSLLIALTE